ncbi:MAG: hypothetical protein DMG05_24025 [Acidobacteria bacterium]|nr:MAG: hypothetical protein DMG05_24025 [Acidobacteriota bacterium]
MCRIRTVFRRLQSLFRKDRMEDDLSEELQFHLESEIQKNIAAGMTPEEARFAALRVFGGVEQIKEESRDVRRSRWIETFGQDVRFGLRILRQRPGITLIIVFTLALGVGATTAIFGVINAVLLQPLPYKDSDRIMVLWSTSRQGDAGVSLADFADWRDQNQVFTQVASWGSREPLVLIGKDEADPINAMSATASFFSLLGVRTALGRTFLPEEDNPGGKLVVVLSHSLWQRRFGGDPNVVGKAVRLSEETYTVVGVLPSDFRFFGGAFGGSVDLWTSQSTYEAVHWGYRWNRVGNVIAKLKPAMTLKEAQAGMDVIASRLQKQYPTTNAGWGIEVLPLREVLVRDLRPTLLILLAAVGSVLLIVCANVANLLLARAVARQREITVRMALGASRLRLIRQLLTESLLLSGLGGIAGLLVGAWFVVMIATYLPQELRAQYRSLDLNRFRIDGLVLSFMIVASLLSGLLFGLAPALYASKSNLNEGLKEGRSLTTGSRPHRWLNLFVVSELGLSLVLLISAGLMLKSLWLLEHVKLGFNPENLLSMTLFLNPSKYSETPQKEAFFRQLIQRIQELPRVQSVCMAIPPPLSGSGRPSNFVIDGRPEPTPAEMPSAQDRYADPNFFAVVGIPLVKGRVFTEADMREGAPEVVIISNSMSQRFWPGQNPLDKRIRITGRGASAQWMSVVGVVGDVRHELNAEGPPTMYRPLRSPGFAAVLVRTASDQSTLAATLGKVVSEVDKEQPLLSVLSMEQVISQSLWESRFILRVIGLFALVALLLATIGVYGVMSYRVSERRHEIGIRMALGARSGDLISLLVGHGLRLVLIGVGLGLITALGATRFIASLLYGVTPTDRLTFACVSLALAGVALTATYVSARKATRVDPMVALRCE